MKLLLHIGTGKTGSTSIQSFLDLNRDPLRKLGFYLPKTYGDKAHIRLFSVVRDSEKVRFLRARGLITPEQQARAKAIWLDDFNAEMRGVQGAHTCILTEENFCSLDTNEIGHLKSILSEHFCEIEVLVYIRDPIEYAVSMYDTALKIGGLGAQPSKPQLKSPTDYRHLIKIWGKHFGMDALNVRIFDRKTLVKNDIISDFRTAARFGPHPLKRPQTANESLNLLGKDLMLAINRKLPPFLPNGRPNPQRKQIHRAFETHFNGSTKYVPPAELVQAYHRKFARSNEWVRRNYFPEKPVLFASKEYGQAATEALSPEQREQVANLIVELWTQS